VLLRAVLPMEGIEVIAANRSGRPESHWCDGPAKICQALALTGAMNGVDVTDTRSGLWIEEAPPIPDERVVTGKRVGIGSVPEPWRSIPWRFIASLKDSES